MECQCQRIEDLVPLVVLGFATPHLGAQTHEAQVRAAVNVAEEILAALRGDELRWKIV